MKIKALPCLLFVLGTLVAEPAPGAPSGRVFELRTYTASPGKLEALNARFRDHTIGLFKKHGMEVVGFWEPLDKEAGAGEKLVYMLAHQSRAAAEASWKAFRERSGVGQGEGRLREGRRPHHQDRERLPRGDGLLALEVARATRGSGLRRSSVITLLMCPDQVMYVSEVFKVEQGRPWRRAAGP